MRLTRRRFLGAALAATCVRVTSVEAGTVRVARFVFEVPDVQPPEPPCEYAVTPLTQAFLAAGGAGVVSVTATCAWNATATVDWLRITSVTTTQVTYLVTANKSAAARVGRLLIAGQTVTVQQAGKSKKR